MFRLKSIHQFILVEFDPIKPIEDEGEEASDEDDDDNFFKLDTRMKSHSQLENKSMTYEIIFSAYALKSEWNTQNYIMKMKPNECEVSSNISDIPEPKMNKFKTDLYLPKPLNVDITPFELSSLSSNIDVSKEGRIIEGEGKSQKNAS